MPRPSVLVVGVSTRAVAESAARAGWRVTSYDAFGDLDQPPQARIVALERDLGLAYDAGALARAARGERCDAVAYVSNLENHPDAVARLARGRRLLGNDAAALRAVRDPPRLERALRRRGFETARVHAHVAPTGARWLAKPRASGGGSGVRAWRGGAPAPASHYLQERIAGVPASLVFAADGVRAVPLALSRQLVGEPAFGARGFRYCGNILAADDDILGDALCDTAAAMARALTEAFGLVGVNGVDFIVRGDGVPIATEVNPRWSASMELAERAFGLSMFAVHARACAGTLPRFDHERARRGMRGAVGKAVLWAPRALRAGDTSRWLGRDGVRDVPRPGERIARGRPVCTAFAAGADVARCRAALERQAARLYASLQPAGPPGTHA